VNSESGHGQFPAGVGVYIPRNPALDDVIAAGRGYRRDHAYWLLHSISTKRWMGEVDDEGFARLNSSILRKRIQPRALGALVRHLVDSGTLKTAGHSTGHFPTGYRIAPAFDGPPVRHVIEHPALAAKIRGWRAEYKLSGKNPALTPIMERRAALMAHEAASLMALSLPATPEALTEELRGQTDPGHIMYVAQAVENHDDDGLVVDAFGWRLHHLITRTSPHLRARLLLAGKPVAEVDVANSQPLLLAMLLQEAKSASCALRRERSAQVSAGEESRGQEEAGRLSIMLCIRSLCCAFSPCVRELSVSEIGDFLSVCESGALYDVLAQDAGIARDQAKCEIFRDVLFGKAHVNGRLTQAFGERWPTLLASIRSAKRGLGYKSVAQALQRLESVIMLDGVGSRLLREFPGLPFLTVHDSALLVAGAAGQIKTIMLEEFARWGTTPMIRVKGAT